MADVKANIREVFDLKKMVDFSLVSDLLLLIRGVSQVIDALVADKRLLNMIFMKCGEKELKYIKVLGGKIGLVFGLIQMSIWWVSLVCICRCLAKKLRQPGSSIAPYGCCR